jgi:hypothetical protein
MTVARASVLITMIVLAGVVGNAVVEQHAFQRAVEDDASRRGTDPRNIRIRSQWPLELYDSALARVTAPGDAARIVGRADSVAYYLVPIAGSAEDSTLVQVFWFQFARRANSVVVEYRLDGTVLVDGSDAVPVARPAIPATTAKDWLLHRWSRDAHEQVR